MRKILHLISRFDIGGTERQFVERLRRHPRGFEPIVACSDLYGKFLKPIREMGIEPIQVPVKSLAKPDAILAAVKLAQLMRREGVKLVHANDFAMSVIGLLAARMAGVKIIVMRVDLGHLRAGFGKWHRKLEMFVARNADLVCANADAVRDLCIREEGCDPERVVVLRNGLDLPWFDAESRKQGQPLPEGRLVAMIGNIWPVKGHRVLVDAAAMLKDKFPDVKFVCAGEGFDEKEYIQRKIAALGLEDRVILLGHRTDIPSILARSTAFTLCSSAEGLSNAVMEGMAARLPCVCTSVGGNPELLADGRGVLVPYGDANALSAALTRVLENADEAREMGKKARAFVEAELSLTSMQAAHEELYLRALGEPSVPREDRAAA